VARAERISQARLIRAAEILAEVLDLNGDEQAAALQRDGFAEGEAWRIVALLPIAFSRPVLEELGVRRFVTEITALRSDGTQVTVSLMRQPEYVAALKLARLHRRKGTMNHEAYKRIAGSSSDMDAASKALNEGKDIAGAIIAHSVTGDEVARHLLS
jgi:hypothetical protein